jgi:hypothetical protein
MVWFGKITDHAHQYYFFFQKNLYYYFGTEGVTLKKNKKVLSLAFGSTQAI